MTAAYRLKGLGWFASCVGAVLAFYLVSLQVAAERKKLDVVNGRIRVAERDIRALETEFDTRANLAQLERWNGETLALVAPTAAQFVRNEAELAQVSFTGAPGGAEVQTAMVVPALPLPPEPVADAAPVIAPAIVVQPAPAAPAMVRVAATAPVRGPATRPDPATRREARKPATKPVPASAPTMIRAAASAPAVRAKPQMAMLDRKLLSDSTFGDIVSGARAEARLR